ncbi:9717_t:CDS:2 [Paraglomus brasilianum]|uniref:9717_t:CDS:1 n=1 Tax=Paraglomus brasilianum TaxID=144538 RepID=A0A9N8WNK1_9GLOM|nr:9717_t:CDS:2 [Paraglomus brasilianum]
MSSNITFNPADKLGQHIDGLELCSTIGIGAYGVVYSAINPTTNKTYAVKCLPKSLSNARQARLQYAEISHHAQVSDHPNIVKLEKIIDTPDSLNVVMELCQGGDLFSMITEKGGYVGRDLLIKKVFVQLLDAVQYCHRKGIYHRDLKPENILVFDDGRTVKLTDFGLATTEPWSRDFGCGSTFYMSPGGLYRKVRSYSTAANDIWSLGVILINLTCGRNPWKQACLRDETFAAFLWDQDFLKTILPLSDELNSILKDVFRIDPLARISLDELRARILKCRQFTVAKYDAFSRAKRRVWNVHRPEEQVVQERIPPQEKYVAAGNAGNFCEPNDNESSLKTLRNESTDSSATACSWYSMNSQMDFTTPANQFLGDYSHDSSHSSASNGSTESVTTLANSDAEMVKCVEDIEGLHLGSYYTLNFES